MGSTADYPYFYPIQVRFADTDLQGHVFFANYLTYFDEALSGYMRAVGVPWRRLQEMGLDIFYVDTRCSFRGAATFEDRLQVYARMERIGNTSFTLGFAIHHEGEEQAITTGSITVVVVDPEARKPVRVPDELRQAVAEFEGRAPGQQPNNAASP